MNAADYMSVSAAIHELREATHLADLARPATVKLPPLWPKVHAREEQRLRQNLQQSQQASRAKLESYAQVRSYASATPSRDMATGDLVSSRTALSALSEVSTRSGMGPALGETRKSSNLLNSPTTHRFVSPSKSSLASNNYGGVGEDSMFGSQALSYRNSSASFGFGTSTRDQLSRLYISPRHLSHQLCVAGADPGSYEATSSLGRQVLDSKTTSPSRSFGLSDRWDAERRETAAAHRTPGPGTYRV